MKKLALFPYAPDTDTVLRYRQHMEGYEIAALLSYREDARALRRAGETYGIPATWDIAQAMAHADAVLLADNEWPLVKKKYVDILLYATAHDNEILMTRGVRDALGIGAMCGGLLENPYAPSRRYPPDVLEPLRVPVITVAGLGEGSGKFETLLATAAALKGMGIHTRAVSANPLGALFGMHTWPRVLFDPAKGLEEKVFALNHMLYDLSKQQRFDALLLEIPGGVMPVGEKAYNHFSEAALAICAAAPPDAGVLSVYYTEALQPRMVMNTRQLCWHKYRMPIEGMVISQNMMMRDPDTKAYNRYRLSGAYLQRHPMAPRAGLPVPVASLNSQEEIAAVAAHIVQLMQGSPAVV
nr:hypothetical protein [Maliibacterium massiliense]